MTRILTSLDQIQRRARDLLPPAVYHYVEGGKEGERTVAANARAFDRVLFSPKVAAGVTDPVVATTVLGREIAMPVIIAPTGYVRIVHPDGELAAARAAARAGIPIAISTLSAEPVDAVTAANSEAWFQLYMIGGREGARFSMDRAREAGCRVLIVTVDVAAVTPHDRSSRRIPARLTPASALGLLPEIWNRPRWLLSLLRGGLVMSAPNAPLKADGSAMVLQEAGRLLTAAPPNWEDLAWIRSQWDGPMVVKGVLRIDDAMRAIDIGADAISVSNHGGKVLDGTPAALSVLPEIVDAVDGRLEVLLDGGVRRGADVVRACALGAKAVLIGRAYLWGLACRGESGVSEVLDLFRWSMTATLSQLGCPSIAAVDRSWLRPLPEPHDWNDFGVESEACAR